MANIEKTGDSAVLVLGLPWLRTGTGRVFEAQLKFFREAGFYTPFIALPIEAYHSEDDEIWTRFDSQKDELPASEVLHTTFPRRFSRGGIFGKIAAFAKSHDVIDWYLAISNHAPMTPRISSMLERFTIRAIIANHVYTLGFARKLKAQLAEHGTDVPIIAVTHDIQSDIIRDNAIKNPWTKTVDEREKLFRSEIRVLKFADALVHVSHSDHTIFSKSIPDRPHFLVFPTVPKVVSPNNSDEKHDLLFVGSDHIANYLAVKWFFEQVSPFFGDDPPSLRLVGRIDHILRHRDPQFWDQHKASFYGSINSVENYYVTSKAVIVPMISGRGISIKTIEACACAKPIIGTSYAYRGIPPHHVESLGLRPHDDPESFARQIRMILANPHAASAASSALYDSLFSWTAFTQSMNGLLEGMGIQR